MPRASPFGKSNAFFKAVAHRSPKVLGEWRPLLVPFGCTYVHKNRSAQIADLFPLRFTEGVVFASPSTCTSSPKGSPKVRARFVRKKMLQICHRLCLLTFFPEGDVLRVRASLRDARTRNTSPSGKKVSQVRAHLCTYVQHRRC